MCEHVEIDPSPERKLGQPSLAAKHLTQILVFLFPKWGLDDASTDMFAKINKFKQLKQQNHNLEDNTTDKVNAIHTKLHPLEEVLVNRPFSQSTTG